MFRYRAIALALFVPNLSVAGIIAPFNQAYVLDENGTSILDGQAALTGGPLSLNTSHSIGGGTFSVNLFAQSIYGVLKAASTSLTNTTSQVSPQAFAQIFGTIADKLYLRCHDR